MFVLSEKVIQMPDVTGNNQSPANIEQIDVPESEIPTDGTMHVVRDGQFDIQPTTLFCAVPGIVHPKLADLGITTGSLGGKSLAETLNAMGQPDYYNGSSRSIPSNSAQSHDRRTHLHGQWFGDLNRDGGFHRCRITVRQDEAVWQGTVERIGNFHPALERISVRFLHDGNDLETETRIRRTSGSINRDFVDILEAFVDFISEGSNPP
ncbi:MAG: hypothetical protein ACTS1X_13020 [Parasphingopyxis sp.]|uniref:hypothetical protein n=1 Tax=Parasphingopyxis sp. TaxID=1920299 RepID=UPI003FA02F82